MAIEPAFEIVGEALRRIEPSDPATAARIPGFRAVIGVRNVLAHGYDVVNHARVWQVGQTDLPPLLANVEGLLREAENQHPGNDA